VVFVVGGVLVGGVADHLTSGGFEDPSSEPERADEAPAEHFGTGAPNSLLLVTAESGDVDDPLDCARRQALTDELAGEGAWTK
jgi:RND superfamily putative drug exporter